MPLGSQYLRAVALLSLRGPVLLNTLHAARTEHHVNNINNQLDATISLFIIPISSTCFGRYWRPSSGAQTVFHLIQATVRQHRRCIIPQAVNTVCAPEDGRNYRPKHVELIGIMNKPLLLHLVGCLYYCISDARSYKTSNEHYVPPAGGHSG